METDQKTESRDYHNTRRRAAVTSDDHRRRVDSHNSLSLPTHSPMQSEDYDPPFSTPETSPANFPCTAIVAVDKCSISLPPAPPSPPPPPPPPPPTVVGDVKSPLVVVNLSAPEDMTLNSATAAAAAAATAAAVMKVEAAEGGRRWSEERSVKNIQRRTKRGEMLKRVVLGFRVCEVALSLISFSVMAADKTKGWSGDSFDRYREYRYCVGVNVIAFVYAGLQSYAMAYHLITSKHLFPHHLTSHFIFFMDQALAYLLMSASSAGATRVEDWKLNWGNDGFTEMASASLAMSFSAFVAFASTSVISAYNLFTNNLS